MDGTDIGSDKTIVLPPSDQAIPLTRTSAMPPPRNATSNTRAVDPNNNDGSLPPDRFDEYPPVDKILQFEDQIAIGGQGIVHSANEKLFHRTVAVKTLREEFRNDPVHRKAFLTEARITAQLEHPAVVPVHGIFSDPQGNLHLSMKFVKGRTLKEYLAMLVSRYSRLSTKKIAALERLLLPERLEHFLTLSAAVAYAHAKRVIHRDLKPENIMLGRNGELYIMDWGIAATLPRGEAFCPPEANAVGTLRYIAPEIIRREPYGERADIFLLGLILYEIVYLHSAYDGKNDKELIGQAMRVEIAPPHNRFGISVAADLERIIDKALQGEPAQRYASVREMEADLRCYLAGEVISVDPHPKLSRFLLGIRRRYKLLLFLFVLTLLALVSFGALVLWRDYRRSERLRREEAALGEIVSRGIHSASIFDLFLKTQEGELARLAEECSVRLDCPIPRGSAEEAGKIYIFGIDPKPATRRPSKTYGQAMDFARFVALLPAGGKRKDFEAQLEKLAPMQSSFRNAIDHSFHGLVVLPKTPKEREEFFLNERRPLISWGFLGLTNGLYLCYPCQFDYTQDYDPRKRGWYQDTLSTPEVFWGRPYADIGPNKEIVITGSKPIYSKTGEILGVVGADILLSEVVDLVAKLGSQGPQVEHKYLLDQHGFIITDNEVFPKIADPKTGALQFHKFPQEDILQTILHRQHGYLTTIEHGDKHVYFFIRIQTLGWYYLEKINFALVRHRAHNKVPALEQTIKLP
ncbi:MAG: serine/threonine protein kinase [Victivallaceae bacterium]|nr:serine/threonine protein kinase [Victivallaceae bacterium]